MADFEHIFGPHYGGISEDDTLTRTNQVLYGENLDLTGDTNSINLTPKTNKYLDLSNDCVSMWYDYRVGFMVCDDDKNLYRNGTLKWNGERIYSYWYAKDYLYMIDSGENIYRISKSNFNKANWDEYVTEVETSMVSGSAKYYNIINLEDIAYVSYSKNLYVIDNDSGQIDPEFSYNFISSDVIGMTILGSNIKIYQEDGKILYWGGKSKESVSEIIDLGVRIDAVYQIANIDYIISSGTIYMVNGYTLVPLIYTYYSDVLHSNKIKIDNSSLSSGMAISYFKGIFYIAGDNSDIHIDDGVKEYGEVGILTYGQKKIGLPKALNMYNNITSSGKKYRKILGTYIIPSARHYVNSELYIAYEDESGNYAIDKRELNRGNYSPNNEAEGLLIYNTLNKGGNNTLKKINSIEIRADIQDKDEFDIMYIETRGIGHNDTNLIPLDDKLMGITGKMFTKGRFRKRISKEFYAINIVLRFRQYKNTNKSDGLKYYNLKISGDVIENK